MTRELTRATWPLPWWTVAAPALAIVAAVVVVMRQPATWAYIAPARVSGLPHESLFLVGPIVCLAACWVGRRFCDRHSPLAAPTSLRAGGTLAARILVVLVLTWTGTFLAAAGASLWFWTGRADGGTAYPVEIVLAAGHVAILTIAGLGIGVIVARWHALLWAAAWLGLCLFVVPIEYSSVFTARTSNLEYFLFPATAAFDHRPLVGAVIGALLAWLVFLSIALAVAIAGWQAAVARRSRAVVAASLCVVGLTGLGLVLPVVLPTPFRDGPPPTVECREMDGRRACVSKEQSATLAAVAGAAAPALARLGDLVPADVEVIASEQAVPGLLEQSVPRSAILTVTLSSSGIGDTAFDLAASLGGLPSCSPDGSGSVAWTFAFASWAAPDSVYAQPPESNPLMQVSDDAVRTWFVKNREAIRACTYAGDGP